MLKKILIALVVLVVILVAVIATRPSTFTVSRSATMEGTPDVAFAAINSFKRWNDWSPWDKKDPNMKRTYGGAEAGLGATYAWVGNADVGEGRMTITESVPNEKVGIKLEFLVPFPSTNQTTFTVAPEGNGSKVTWRMDGTLDFFGKAMCLVVSFDQMVGPDFEQGLATMKEVVAKDVAAKKAAEEAAKKAAEVAATATDTGEVAGAVPAVAVPAAK